ncbi:hypothetical protein V1478_013639 [Vespula squamosa]|uniref:Uncharacterized protein n=1 Tax=Vespula squamosa TaxID=30214 RepID=A0ABD2A5P9_VESSQ
MPKRCLQWGLREFQENSKGTFGMKAFGALGVGGSGTDGAEAHVRLSLKRDKLATNYTRVDQNKDGEY